MAVINVAYKGLKTESGPTPAVWGDCPVLDMIADPSVGYYLFDDFTQFGLIGTITTLIGVNNGYNAFGSAGATITPDDALGGGIVLTEATDNESVSITTEQHPFWISQDYGQLWFEARIKTSTITADEQGWVVGLMDTTALAAAVPVTAGGGIADMNFVGFHHPEENLTAFDTSYKANGVTAVEVNSDVGTLAVNTYIKLGMVFNRQQDNKLRFFIDGTEQAATKTIPNATGTDFPADIGLGPVIGQTLANSAAETLTMDWWRCAQLRTS